MDHPIIEVMDITVPSPPSPPPYDVYIALSDRPPTGWDKAFDQAWTGPGMPMPARPVLVSGPYVILQRTTLEEVLDLDLYARVRVAVEKANGLFVLQQQEASRTAQQQQQRNDDESVRRERLLQEIREQAE